MVLGGASYHFLAGPLTALLALGVIVLICRWVFAPPARPVPARRPAPADYGLLVAVARVPEADAERLREVLQSAGIRSTVTPHGDDERLLLVFPGDVDRASELVRS
jgi:hypothetical protein